MDSPHWSLSHLSRADRFAAILFIPGLVSCRISCQYIRKCDKGHRQRAGTSLSKYRVSIPRDIRCVQLLISSTSIHKNAGKVCFACKASGDDLDDMSGSSVACTLCSPQFEYTAKLGQRVVEHIGAHILFDSAISREDEPCGFCLRPSSICRIFLSSAGSGKFKINRATSTGCLNMQNIRYSVAAASKPTAPCSNVPLLCPLCPKGMPAVWRYNIQNHIRSKHEGAQLAKFAHLWTLGRLETIEMARFWKERHDGVVRRPVKASKKIPIVISEAHTTTLALRYVFIYILFSKFWLNMYCAQISSY